MTLSEIVKKENNLETLRKLREIVCDRIDHTSSSRDIAALSRQLILINDRISEQKALQEPDEISDILLERATTGAPGFIRKSRTDLYGDTQYGNVDTI